jgi:predicted glycogen debranching enzyme
MIRPVRIPPRQVSPRPGSDHEPCQEWLVTNGLGGYASGTVEGFFARRYHGLLIAALSTGRWMTLNGLTERLRLPNRDLCYLGAQELSGAGVEHILRPAEFRLEAGLPVWTYQTGGIVLEKRVVLPYRQNTVHIIYRLLAGDGSLRLGIRPAVHFRPHDARVSTPLHGKYLLTVIGDQYQISTGADMPELRMRFAAPDSAFTFDQKIVRNIVYPIEEQRGYEGSGDMWSPGYYRANLRAGDQASLTASTEIWETILALDPDQALEADLRRRDALLTAARPELQSGIAAELVVAADQFLITPASRAKDAARAQAQGEQAWTVIAGYHWFTDWGRDTMISLEGLALETGRHLDARWILRTFSHYIRDGLLPNLFPEGEQEGLYHTADATLWFFHALHRYVSATGDRDTLQMILPKLFEIVAHHNSGTHYGIHVDPRDGLLAQGEAGYQLTWMDAKVGDWVVTPRRGKAVEINGLWYNALSLLAAWAAEMSPAQAPELKQQAEQVRDSFNTKFWSPEHGHLFDVIDGPDGDDPACRPNQLLAFSLDHPVLHPERWEPVLNVVTQRLLTPVGLRSLDPRDPNYKEVYFGDLRARDAAYHQGTVWAWIIGPFVDAWIKVHPDTPERARSFLSGFDAHLNEACIGSISEIFDGTDPFRPRGCVAQAWSVAEVLRCWRKTSVPS